MTLENNRAPLLYHIKLCAPFQIHRWSQTWVTVRKCQIRVKIGDILSRVTLKFDAWPWETIGHLFYTTLSFVHHFKAMGEFKPDYSSGQNQQYFVLCDLQIWRMTLKNNRASLLSCFKFCASFHSHQWIQTRVTVWKRPIWVKINVFLYRVPLKFDRWPWKTIGHLFYATSSFVHHFIAIIEFKLELQSENTQFGSKQMIFLGMWTWNLADDLEKQ